MSRTISESHDRTPRRRSGMIALGIAASLGIVAGIGAKRLSAAKGTTGGRTDYPSTGKGGTSTLPAGAPKECKPGVKLVDIPNEVVVDPQKAGYNTSHLRRLGVSSQDIFANEPRNEAWANVMERDVGSAIVNDLKVAFSDFAVSQFECRTASCKLCWSSKGELDERVMAFISLPGVNAGPRRARTTEGDKKCQYFFYRPSESYSATEQLLKARFDVTDPAAFAARLAKLRRDTYQDAVKGKFMLTPAARLLLKDVDFKTFLTN